MRPIVYLIKVMIKAVLFDLDGILFDSEEYYFQGNLAQLRELGYTGSKEELLKGIGCTMDKIFNLYYELLERKVSIDEIQRRNEEYYESHPIPYKELMFEGVDIITKKLKEDGIQLACCSASSYNIIEEALEEMNIREYFDYIQSAEEVKHPKPYPDVYLSACEHLHRLPEECVVYEDSDFGIESGKRAGMKVVCREDKRFGQNQTNADKIVKDIYELYEWIERENTYAGSIKN